MAELEKTVKSLQAGTATDSQQVVQAFPSKRNGLWLHGHCWFFYLLGIEFLLSWFLSLPRSSHSFKKLLVWFLFPLVGGEIELCFFCQFCHFPPGLKNTKPAMGLGNLPIRAEVDRGYQENPKPAEADFLWGTLMSSQCMWTCWWVHCSHISSEGIMDKLY